VLLLADVWMLISLVTGLHFWGWGSLIQFLLNALSTVFKIRLKEIKLMPASLSPYFG
jgi:hypothetical protein